jgi:hypothetical protein
MATPVLVNGATGVAETAIFVRGESCDVQAYHLYNGSNALAFVQFFDTAAPTVGTTVPKWSIGIPTLVHAFMSFPVAGLYFQGGLWVAATTTVGGSSAPSAALTVNLAMS